MTEDQACAAFLALSNPTRLRIVKALVRASPAGLSAGEIATHIDASPSRASFHLSAIAETGLISVTKQARQRLYQVEFTAAGALMRYFLEECCAGAPAVAACCTPIEAPSTPR